MTDKHQCVIVHHQNLLYLYALIPTFGYKLCHLRFLSECEIKTQNRSLWLLG